MEGKENRTRKTKAEDNRGKRREKKRVDLIRKRSKKKNGEIKWGEGKGKAII